MSGTGHATGRPRSTRAAHAVVGIRKRHAGGAPGHSVAMPLFGLQGVTVARSDAASPRSRESPGRHREASRSPRMAEGVGKGFYPRASRSPSSPLGLVVQVTLTRRRQARRPAERPGPSVASRPPHGSGSREFRSSASRRWRPTVRSPRDRSVPGRGRSARSHRSCRRPDVDTTYVGWCSTQ